MFRHKIHIPWFKAVFMHLGLTRLGVWLIYCRTLSWAWHNQKHKSRLIFGLANKLPPDRAVLLYSSASLIRSPNDPDRPNKFWILRIAVFYYSVFQVELATRGVHMLCYSYERRATTTSLCKTKGSKRRWCAVTRTALETAQIHYQRGSLPWGTCCQLNVK